MKKILFVLVFLISGVLPHQAQTPINDSTSYGACIMRNDSIIGINEDELGKVWLLMIISLSIRQT